MTGDQNKFLSLKKAKKGKVTFGGDVSTKILGKRIVNLEMTKLKQKMCW
jgi:hypothetical protein